MTERQREEVLISPLVADLMTASMTETQRVTDSVIDNLQRRLDRAEAELEAIREVISNLCDRLFVPNVELILGALYPSSELIDHYMPREER